jgi:hypothetical protein
MFTKRSAKEISFYGVAGAIILIGATAIALGGVQWVLNYYADYGYKWPLIKIFGGLVVLSLGYIVLELELLRKK